MTEDQRTQLPPQYAPGEVEARRYDEWVAKGLFAADAGAPGPAYCIVIPPPNVTGPCIWAMRSITRSWTR